MITAMKKILLLAAAAIMAAGVMQAKTADELRIYLNPGHGSWGPNDRPMATIPYPMLPDTGRPDTCGFYESNTNLWKVLQLGETLENMGISHDNIVYSRVKNGPYPYVSGAADAEMYNKPLGVIAEEAEEGNFDMFISVHSNAHVDGTNTNYPLYLYRGYDKGVTGTMTDSVGDQEITVTYAGNAVEGSWDMCDVNWGHHYMNEIDPQSYYSRTSKNLRGDISFQGGGSISQRSSGNYYGGYYGVLKHGVPGFLVEGYFHTYQPARHRALNMDYCHQEGVRIARGVCEYFNLTPESTGYIMGTVKDMHEKIVNNLFNYAANTNDQWLPLNGAVVTLKKDGVDVASYTVDNNYNGIFFFDGLEPGNYTLDATIDGYKPLLDEYKPVTVTANATSYPLLYLESESYEPPTEVYENYPDPEQPGYLRIAGEYIFAQDEGTTYDGIVGDVAQMLQYGDSTIVLSHEGTMAHLYIIDNNTKQMVKELNTEGLYTLDAPIFYNQIGSIALSADRKLVGVTAVRTCYNNDYADGYPRGTMYAYYWEDFDSAPTEWFSTQYSSNWYRSDLGFGVAVSGPINECIVCVPAPTTGSTRGIRPAFFVVQDGNVVSTSRVNAQGTLTMVKFGDPLATEGNASNYPTENFGRIKVAVSPFNDQAFIIGGSKTGELYEFEMLGDAQVPSSYDVFSADEELLGNGYQIFKYAGHTLMVSPYGTAGDVKGVKIYDITNGLANAQLLKTVNTDIENIDGAPGLKEVTAGQADFAWAGAKVNSEDIHAYLLGSDMNVVKFATDDVEQPIIRGIYAYDLNYESNGDSYTFTFKANENAKEAYITFRDENTGEQLAEFPIPDVVLGANEITIPVNQLPAPTDDIPGYKMNWEITLVGEPIARIDLLNELNSDCVYSGCLFNNVDKNPESPHFGNIYVANRISQPNDGNGLYIYDPMMNRQNSVAYHGATMLSSPYRLGVAPDGTVYIPDWSDPYSGVYVADPDNIEADFTQFFEGTRAGSGLFTNNGVNVGGSATSVAFIGTGADTKMYVFSEDVPGPSGIGNGVAIYNVGNEDGTIAKSWGVAPNNYFDIGAKMLNTNGNVIPTEDGGAFVSQVRSAGNNTNGVPSFVYVNPEGSIVYNSGTDLQELNGSLGAGLAISNDGSTLVINNGSGEVEFFDLTWNRDGAAPVITPRGYSFVSAARRNDGSSHNNYIYQMNFDYGGNLIVTGNKVAMYSIPTDNNTSTTPAKMEYVVQTGINKVNTDLNKKVVSVKYVNIAGMESSTPFQGVNIVVTRYEDGSQSTTKVIK